MSYFIIWKFSSDVDEHHKYSEVQLLLHSNDGDTLDPNKVIWDFSQRLLHIYEQLPPSDINNQQRITLQGSSREHTHGILLRYKIIFLGLLAEEI